MMIVIIGVIFIIKTDIIIVAVMIIELDEDPLVPPEDQVEVLGRQRHDRRLLLVLGVIGHRARSAEQEPYQGQSPEQGRPLREPHGSPRPRVAQP